MNPNILLAEIRLLSSRIQAELDAHPQASELANAAHALATLTDQLDGYLSHGGAAPDAWANTVYGARVARELDRPIPAQVVKYLQGALVASAPFNFVPRKEVR